MSSDVLIAPSILSADFGRLSEEVHAAEEAGADWIHIDVMDGHFVPNITMGPDITAAVRRATSLPVDVHLMIEKPERFIRAFADAGADRITVHQETCPHLHRILAGIREAGARPGVALNPATPVGTLLDAVAWTDLVLLMTVNPGFGGQSFISESVPKLQRLRRLLVERELGGSVLVQVDGGIGPASAPAVVGAGAQVLVAGSALYGAPDGLDTAVAQLRAAAAGGKERRV